ncbi:MFS transporter PAT family beta-lactamase induction signal transducer ampG [Clonorchis sinensis]|uniref:MFS transporter PAT family beta-lactamase induction signal transducer ampG n=2 Tax=Clonorchis sinensis TaxID=79923 RepID=G7YBE2_CLOSI|nr:MFS transporter PAT family beta-lactamase induction signal transducer ampG [Clonorchis sinensis]
MLWTLLLLFYLYLLEGIPYGLQSRFLPLLLRSSGLSLTALGFYKLLYVPWLLKSFYAPLVDLCLTKRYWLFGSLVGLLSVTLTLTLGENLIPRETSSQTTGSASVFPLALCLFLYNLFAATQDIAVDGVALQLLSSDQLSVGNTIQVVGYKFGAIVGGGFLTAATSLFSASQLLGIIACIYVIGAILCITSTTLRDVEAAWSENQTTIRVQENGQLDDEQPSRMKDDGYTESVRQASYVATLSEAVINSVGSRNLIALLLIYKLGEQGAMNMLPLMLFDRGASVAKIGLWSGMVGQLSSILGSTFAHKLQATGRSSADVLERLMLFRAILQLPLLLIAVERVGIGFHEYSFAVGMLFMNLTLFVSGAITTVMFTIMMQCTRAESPVQTQATHYTVLSTAELLGKLIFGVIAAPFTDYLGYGTANLTFVMLSVVPVYFIRARRDCFLFEGKLS